MTHLRKPPCVQGPFWGNSLCFRIYFREASGCFRFPNKTEVARTCPLHPPFLPPILGHQSHLACSLPVCFWCASGVLPGNLLDQLGQKLPMHTHDSIKKKTSVQGPWGETACASGYTSGKLPGASGSSNKTKMFVDESSKRVLPPFVAR